MLDKTEILMNLKKLNAINRNRILSGNMEYLKIYIYMKAFQNSAKIFKINSIDFLKFGFGNRMGFKI